MTLFLLGNAVFAEESPIALGKPVAKEISVVTFPIPLMVENEQTGLFLDLTREIAQRNNFKVNFRVMQIGNALLEFSNNKYDIFLPAHHMSVPKAAVKSIPFFHKKDFIFYRKGSPLNTLKDLEGKKVGLTFRYFYINEMLSNKKIRFEYAEDDFINMKKLGDGLIDAFVVERKSGLKAVQQSGHDNIEFNGNFPLSEQPVYFAFQETAEGRRLNEIFSSTLLKMKEDGSLSRLLGEK